MVRAKEATMIAVKYVAEMFNANIDDTKLEELEYDGNSWLVTVSFAASITKGDSFLEKFGLKRVYKIIKVRESDGEVVSMKIRELSNAN
jgi:hypothetical protein